MSTAHRPTWAPAVGRETAGKSAQTSARDQTGHTKLKFRKPGQGTANDVARRDLRLELAQAEKRAKAKKDGVSEAELDAVSATPVAAIEAGDGAGDAEEQASKRRKLLEEAAELDKDDEDDEDAHRSKRARSKSAQPAAVANVDADEDSDDDDDSEDETAELLRELEKIKRERAEEKERQERERLESDSVDRETSIATGNPLMNLEAALNSRAGSESSGFAVKRRWDDDVIFKNQARGVNEAPKGGFVNDLLRTEFHKRFLKKFVQ